MRVALLTWVLAAAPTSIERPIEVEAIGCRSLDVDALRRLLDLELADALAGHASGRPSRIEIECRADAVRIAIADPITSKKLEREIPRIRATEPEPERILALAISELFVASWLELLVPDSPAVAGTSVSAAVPTPRQVEAARSAAVRAVERPTRRDEVVVTGGARWRRLPGSTALGNVGLGYGAWLVPSWGVFGAAQVEYGRARRNLGVVDAFVIELGAEGAWRSPRQGPVTFDAGLSIDAAFVRLRGRATEDAVSSGAVSALAADFGARIGPTLHARRFRTTLAFEGGVMLPGPEGRVSGDDSVRVDGAWVGFALRLAFVPGVSQRD